MSDLPSPADQIPDLVRAASAGNADAWSDIVDRYSPLLWSVVRRFGLSNQDAADVVQTTWLRLLEHLDKIQDSRALPAWLATTARREALRTLHQAQRQVSTDPSHMPDVPATPDEEPAQIVEDQEVLTTLRMAIAQLPPRQRAIIQALVDSGSLSYPELASAVGMPVGSIGPTRQRALSNLRSLLPLVRPVEGIGTTAARRLDELSTAPPAELVEVIRRSPEVADPVLPQVAARARDLVRRPNQAGPKPGPS